MWRMQMVRVQIRGRAWVETKCRHASRAGFYCPPGKWFNPLQRIITLTRIPQYIPYLNGLYGWYPAVAGVVGVHPLTVRLEAVVQLVRQGGAVVNRGLVLNSIMLKSSLFKYININLEEQYLKMATAILFF